MIRQSAKFTSAYKILNIKINVGHDKFQDMSFVVCTVQASKQSTITELATRVCKQSRHPITPLHTTEQPMRKYNWNDKAKLMIFPALNTTEQLMAGIINS